MNPVQKANEIAELRDKKWTSAEYRMFLDCLHLITEADAVEEQTTVRNTGYEEGCGDGYREGFKDGYTDGVTQSELKNADAKTFP